MEKVHYCERFIELMIDLEVRWLLYQQAGGAEAGLRFMQKLVNKE